MKLLVCYEMAHNKGFSTGDSIVPVPGRSLTQAVLDGVRSVLRAACEERIRSEGLTPTGMLIFRSVVKLDG